MGNVECSAEVVFEVEVSMALQYYVKYCGYFVAVVFGATLSNTSQTKNMRNNNKNVPSLLEKSSLALEGWDEDQDLG